MKVLSFFQDRSYADMFPYLDILREKNIFIEVGYYSLRIPVKHENTAMSSVDIFAETVMRLLALDRHYTEKQIADKMCVDTDFIRCILSRLRGQGAIDSANKILQNAVSSADSGQNLNNSAPEQHMHAFFIKATGDFLSCLTKKLEYEDARFSDNDKKVTILRGTSGRVRTVTGICLRSGRSLTRWKRSKPESVKIYMLCIASLLLLL